MQNTMIKLQTYADAESFLNGFVDYEKTPPAGARLETKPFDLETFRDLLRNLGDPHLKYAAIHVAGTKGKGSTCAFLASALQECGLKVGLYTSPHITRFTERIQVNGRPIADETFCALLQLSLIHI